MTTTVLALDLATRTGYAWWSPGMEKPKAGIVDLPSDVVRGKWLRALYTWADDFSRMIKATHIGVEKPITTMGDENKIIKLICAAGMMEMLGDDIGASVDLIANNSMFAHWVGRVDEEDRKAKDWRKSYSVLAAMRHGWNVKDHNVADALGVLSYYTWKLDLKTPWDNQKNPGSLFRKPQGVVIDKSNEVAAARLVNNIHSFNAKEPTK